MNREQVIKRCKELGPWFHQIDLGDGLLTRDIAPRKGPQPPDHPIPRWKRIKDVLPADLTGMRILDIGCCDGFFSVEMAKRNAREILSIDGAVHDIERLRWAKDHLGLSAIKPYVCDLYQLEHFTPGARAVGRLNKLLGRGKAARAAGIGGIGKFDFVFMLAVLYHLRDPLTALEIISKLSDTLYIETIAVDDEVNSNLQLIFPRDGVNNNPKWFPTTRCVKDMLTLVGYKHIEEISHIDYRKEVTDKRVMYVARK